MNTNWAIRQGDAAILLSAMPPDMVDCCITSPPYYRHRDYGVEGQIGQEETPEAYIETLVGIFNQVRRALAPHGTLWLNLGDSYGPKKQLLMIPARVALALQADGWILRQDIVWSKPNPMTESVKDRPTTSHEHLFLFAKNPAYFYDQELIREPVKPTSGIGIRARARTAAGPLGGENQHAMGPRVTYQETRGANRRSVWHIQARPFLGAHFATFPPDLVEPCILAGTSERGVCSGCGKPWKRILQKGEPDIEHQQACGADASGGYGGHATKDFKTAGAQDASATKARILAGMVKHETIGWAPTCGCDLHAIPALVFDPFTGSGTVGAVAMKHGRHFLGLELNPEYCGIARRRIEAVINPAPIRKGKRKGARASKPLPSPLVPISLFDLQEGA